MTLDKEQHKREQNEQFENSFKRVQKYYEKQFKRAVMIVIFDAIIAIITVLLIAYFMWRWSRG